MLLRLVTGLALLSGAARPAAAADFDWIQTARVFLIDAYEPPFEPKLEYDAQALAETMSRMHADTVRIATMGKYALIPGVGFTPHPALGQRDILAETIAAAKPRGIRVVPYVSTGHKLAWTMVTRDHPEYAQRTSPGGGPARSHMFAGEDHGTVCWNTPYRKAYLDLIERLARDYEIAGMYFDTWTAGYFWPGRAICYCDGCRNGFRKASGAELPWHERDEDYTPAEAVTIERYHAWYHEVLVDTVQQVRKIVKSHKNIPLIYNIANPLRMAVQDPRILAAMDGFLYERGNSILERAEGVSLARAAGLGVWPYVGEYNNWPRTIHNGLDFQQQIFTTAMFGGAPILALPWGYVNHPENRGYVEYPFGVIQRHEKEFAGFENYPYAAVVYGARTPPGHAQSGTWWKTDVRSSSLGAFAACLYGHVQVSSVHEQILDDPARLKRYRVLYLADFTHLSESRIRNIKDFVRDGGGLLATYATSLYDGSEEESGKRFSRIGAHIMRAYGSSLVDAPAKRLERFALEDLLRAAPIEPSGELAETVANYRSMTGGPYDLYLAGRPKPTTADLTPLWTYLPVKALDGGEVWKDIVTGDGMRPILPGVIISQYGKGRVVYSASALESLFLQQNSRAVGGLLRELVVKAAGEPPPYQVEAPAALIANLTYKGDVQVLHMTNWTGNKLERPGTIENYLAPVENVRIRLAIPEGRRVRSVSLLVDGHFTQARKGSTLEVLIPRIESYQAVRVEWEPK
jgi:hypothetical protein